MKPLEGCDHVCSSRCHTGPCPPCSVSLVRSCRCGATTRDVKCFEEQLRLQARERGELDNDILCEKACMALRNCGRHECKRPCCPLASLASVAKKGKRKATNLLDRGEVDDGGWHECDLICGKMLSCGNHKCEERDHRGLCPPCLRSSFEEVCSLNHHLLIVNLCSLVLFRCSVTAAVPSSSRQFLVVLVSIAQIHAIAPTLLVDILKFNTLVMKILLHALLVFSSLANVVRAGRGRWTMSNVRKRRFLVDRHAESKHTSGQLC